MKNYFYTKNFYISKEIFSKEKEFLFGSFVRIKGHF